MLYIVLITKNLNTWSFFCKSVHPLVNRKQKAVVKKRKNNGVLAFMNIFKTHIINKFYSTTFGL